MASNPMQKKSRNAFLGGMLLMLIIAAIIIVIMFMTLKKNTQKKQEEEETTQTYVYRLNTSVKSGETITSSMVTSVLVNTEAVPTGAVAAKTKTTENGKDIWKDKTFDYVGYKSKIDLDAGTIISDNMLYEVELNDSERIQEYNMLQLPIQLDIGEFVDIRLLMSNGQDYIVVSHKEVIDITGSTIWLQLSEEEILLMSNAIVESYISSASTLYVAKYVEPGTQNAATITYIPSAEVINLINQDSNIIQSAREELVSKYQNSSLLRGHIQTELNKYEDEEKLGNIEENMLEAREKAKEEREEFLYGIE